jgi:hypothetical protein
MTPTERDGERRARLYVREDLPATARRRRESVVEQLATVDASGHLAEYEIVSWPKRFARHDTDHTSVREQFNAISQWARERGVRLTPFFGTRECYSMETGAKDDWVVLPVFCLTVFEGGRLQDVYPHADGETTRSVFDGLESLTESTTEESRDRVVVSAD